MGNILDLYSEHKTYTKVAEVLGISRDTAARRIKKALKEYPAKLPSSQEPIKKPAGDVLRVVYFTDAHNQIGVPLDRFKWLALLINDVKPDAVVDGGDFDDWRCFCSHEKDETFEAKTKPTFKEELMWSAQARNEIKKHLTHDCPKYVTLGNHEVRIWKYENDKPATNGSFVDLYLDVLKLFNWQPTLFKQYLNIGGVEFTHAVINAMGREIGGKGANNNIATNSLRDICYGHSHKKDEFVAAKFGPDNRSVRAYNGGCFMPHGLRMNYAKASANVWDYGLSVISIRDGRIDCIQWISMRELEEKYG